MSDHMECEECRAIREEWKSARGEIAGKREFIERVEAIFRLIGGTEADAERADGVLERFQVSGPCPGPGSIRKPIDLYPGHAEMRHLFQRMYLHRRRTGHSPAL